MNHIERLQQYIDEDRLIRKAWTDTDEQGRETACLLAALAPECGAAKSATACPAAVMPEWLAHLTPWIDDEGSVEAWPAMVRRFAAVAARWHSLDDDAWQRAAWRMQIACINEALRHVTVDNWGVRNACLGVIEVLQKAVESGKIDETARAAAEAAAREAGAAEWAAREVEWAARATEWAAREAGARAAEAAAAAADRLTDAILSILESECDARAA